MGELVLWEQYDYKKDFGERRRERYSPGRRRCGARGLIVNFEVVYSLAFCGVRSDSSGIYCFLLLHWGNL